MLQLVPRNWFSWNFDVLENGQSIAQINSSSWRERGTLSVEGASYRVYREGLVSGEFILEQEGQPIAHAQKPSAFFNSFHLEYPGKEFTLRKKSIAGRSFLLLEGERVVGAIEPASFFARRANVSLPDDMPKPVKIFAIWLVILMWKREAHSSTAGTT